MHCQTTKLLRSATYLLGLILIVAHGNCAFAQLDQKLVANAKSATVLVERPSGDGFGTAFCIDNKGFFITNHHVIVGETEKIPLIQNPGTGKEKKLLAEIVRSDEDLDLALLRVVQLDTPLIALDLGSDEGLTETQPISVFGYPFGTGLALRNAKYPNISVNVGRITSLRKRSSELKKIQLDAVVNPGNSGGPVIDSGGKVVGVIDEKVEGTDVNFAIPVTILKGFLSRPEAILLQEEIRFAEREEPVDLKFNVASFGSESQDIQLKVQISNGIDSNDDFTLDEPDAAGHWVVNVTPMEKSEEPLRIPVTITYKSGKVKGEIAEQPISFAGSRQYLIEMKSIAKVTDNKWRLTRYDGKSVAREGLVFSDLQVYLGGTKTKLDLDSVRKIELGVPEQRFVRRLRYNAKVYADGKLASILRGEIPLVGVPGDAETDVVNDSDIGMATLTYSIPDLKPEFEEDELVYEFDEPFDEYVMGGADRFMIFKFGESKQIKIFDLIKGDVVHQIDNVDSDAILCAGSEELFIVLPSQMLMQRWNLESFRREKTSRLPLPSAPKYVHIGVNSSEYIVLAAGQNAYIINVNTLKPMQVSGKDIFYDTGNNGHPIRISADGATISGIPTTHGRGFKSTLIADKYLIEIPFSGDFHRSGFGQPSPNGRLFFFKNGKIYNVVGKDVTPDWFKDTKLYTTVDPRYFISFKWLDGVVKGKMATVDICTASDLRVVSGNVHLEELATDPGINSFSHRNGQINSGKVSIHYVPWANLLANPGYDSKRVYVRKFDFAKQLAETGEDFIFVESLPPMIAYKGKPLRYQVQCQTNSDSVAYKLVEGPSGMRISNSGLLTWKPSRGAVEEFVSVVINVAGNKGDETFHTFDLLVAPNRAVRR